MKNCRRPTWSSSSRPGPPPSPPTPASATSLSGRGRARCYTGRLLNGTTFDNMSDPTQPFVFRVGRELVIQGWDYILPQMKRGERRLIIVPPELAYGTRGQPPRIPRNATLVFVIELLDIKHD
ncbi:MAG: FKBP-type peptidyl-prolyl cis-trans isomerase [Opitutales bacterium]|nr:FKBP-type peptidyl-prolyl cis-trans isomerase [Opitutales bacterium]